MIINHVFKLKSLAHFTIRSENEALFENLNPNHFLAFDRWFRVQDRLGSNLEDHLHSFYYPLMQLPLLTTLHLFIRVHVRTFCLPTALFPNLARLLLNVPGLRCEHAAIICPACCRDQLEHKLVQKFAFLGKVDLRNREYIDFLNTIQNE